MRALHKDAFAHRKSHQLRKRLMQSKVFFSVFRSAFYDADFRQNITPIPNHSIHASCMCVCMCVCMYVCMCVYVCMYVCMLVYGLYVHERLSERQTSGRTLRQYPIIPYTRPVCMHICMYVCTCVCVLVCL